MTMKLGFTDSENSRKKLQLYDMRPVFLITGIYLDLLKFVNSEQRLSTLLFSRKRFNRIACME